MASAYVNLKEKYVKILRCVEQLKLLKTGVSATK